MGTPQLTRDMVERIIAAAWPALHVHTVEAYREGWANVTWLVNGGLLFRFPKTAAAAAATRKEMALLPVLAQRLPLPVPNFRYRAPAGARGYPWPFAGYDLVPGEPAAERGVPLAPHFAPALADFLTALHRFPVAQAAALGVPGGTAAEWRAEYLRWYRETRELIWPRLSLSEQQRISAEVEGFLGNVSHFAFRPVLLHRDLSPDHLLLDERTGELTGVIDFEDAMIGDPAFDFTGLDFTGLDFAGPGNVTAAVLALYEGPVDAEFAQRIAFYRKLIPLHALRYGIEVESTEHIQKGLTSLRRSLGA